MQEDLIKKYIDAANTIVIHGMYLKRFQTDNKISLNLLKEYNPGHLGTSMSLNYILGNLYYFMNNCGLTHKLIVGDGHAGISLISNLWLNGTLEKSNPLYTRNIDGLNRLINDFGVKIRSEINPEYPDTIYDGGELGYSLGVAYGYALLGKEDIIPCIIGDGEAETGALSSAWQLIKILKLKSKVLPIINLNGLKMGSSSILSMMNDEELEKYFSSLGYQVFIVDTTKQNMQISITKMQNRLNKSIECNHPLIIVKSLKGYTLPLSYEGNINVHKNPLDKMDNLEKVNVIQKFLQQYDNNFFDEKGNLIKEFNAFSSNSVSKELKDIKLPDIENMNLDNYLSELIRQNNGLVFSPDEIFSNKFYNCSNHVLEILNEVVLQAMYQGYIQAGGMGYYISYEGFMPIISSMITQYYKYLKQKSGNKKHSLNYILTSTCWENTYSHQNPDFVNSLFEKKDSFYNVMYPKDINNAIKCIEEFSLTNDQINVLTISKRHNKIYQDIDNTNTRIEIMEDNQNPDIILCATGDYMLDYLYKIKEKIQVKYPNIKIIYVTKPQILGVESKESLSNDEFLKYFNHNVPIVYLFNGYSMAIKALFHERNCKASVFGYNDGISIFGNLANNIANNIPIDDIIEISNDKTKILK